MLDLDPKEKNLRVIFWAVGWKNKKGITVCLLAGNMNLTCSKELQQQGFQILSQSGFSAAPTITFVPKSPREKRKWLTFIKSIHI